MLKYLYFILYFFIVSHPVIINHPVSTNTSVHTTVQFSCTARGFQLIDVIWKKEGSSRLPRTAVLTTSTSPDMNEITSTLQISETIGYYNGQYYCVVKNSAGSAFSHMADLNMKGILSIGVCHTVRNRGKHNSGISKTLGQFYTQQLQCHMHLTSETVATTLN